MKPRRQKPAAPHPRPAEAAAAPPPDPTAEAWNAVGAAGLWLAAFLLYAPGVYPDVGPVDSGELALAAWAPGVAHAPGFPAYVFAGWLWSRLLAWGSVAWRLNLFSAACAALAVSAAYRLGLRLLVPPPASPPSAGARGMAAAGALLLATGPVFWHWALTTEVYAFHSWLMAAACCFAFSAAGRRRRQILCGIFTGMALAVHWVSVLALLPLLLGLLWPAQARPRSGSHRRSGWQEWTLPAGSALGAALLFYLGLMALARSAPLLNWGSPTTPERLWWHITARQYQTNLFSASGPELLSALGGNLALWLRESGYAGLLLVFWGAWGWHRRPDRGPLLWGWLASVLLTLSLGTLQAAAYSHPTQDRDAYLLPLFFCSSLAAASGMQALAARIPGAAKGAARALPWLAMAALVLLAAVRLPGRSRAGDTASADYARNALRTVAPQALVLAADWQLVSPSLYLTEVCGFRRDVLLIDIPLWQNRPWYLDQFARRDPGRAAEWKPFLDPFLSELRVFEAGRLQDSSRIARAYAGLLEAMLQCRERPVYLDSAAREHFRQFGAGRSGFFLPEGLLFRYYAQNPPGSLPELDWAMDSLLDRRYGEEPIRQHMREQHRGMLQQRLLFYRQRGETPQAARVQELADRWFPPQP